MARTIRSRNLDLIRWLNYGHDSTAKLLASVTNPSYLSKMATGEMDISDRKARSIEKSANLPVDWLDRNNIDVLGMTQIEYKLHQVVVALSPERKNALLTLLSKENDA